MKNAAAERHQIQELGWMFNVYAITQVPTPFRPVFLNSGPHDPLPCMFSMFPSSTTPDSNDQLIIKLCSGLIRSHSLDEANGFQTDAVKHHDVLNYVKLIQRLIYCKMQNHYHSKIII